MAALPHDSPLAFLLLRQAGLADCLLLLVLLLALKSEGGHPPIRAQIESLKRMSLKLRLETAPVQPGFGESLEPAASAISGERLIEIGWCGSMVMA